MQGIYAQTVMGDVPGGFESFPADIDVIAVRQYQAFGRQPVGGQGPCFVAGDKSAGPQPFHRGQQADDDVAFSHAMGGDGQCHSNGHRQPFGDGGHRQCHGEEECLYKTGAAQQLTDGEYHDERQGDDGDNECKVPEAQYQRRRCGASAQGGRDAADLGARPGTAYHPRGASFNQVCAGMEQIIPVGDRRAGIGHHRLCVLRYRGGFAGQQRFIGARLVREQ